MQVNFKKMRPGAIIPTKATAGSNGLDVFYPNGEQELLIKSKLRALVPSGFAIEIPVGFAVFLMSRSGQGHKQRVRLSNSVGLIDTDYRGELMLSLTNDGPEDYEIKPGQAIGQIVFVPLLDAEPVDVGDAELQETTRGAKGFGSSDSAGITSLGVENLVDVPVADPTDLAASALGAAPVASPAPVRVHHRTHSTGTTTSAELSISGPAFSEIENKLRIAGYDHLFVNGGIDMDGLRLVKE